MPTNLDKFISENNKENLIFDFDKTIAKILVDWTPWPSAMNQILKKYNPSIIIPNTFKGAFKIRNEAVKKYGEAILKEIRIFNLKYEEGAKGIEPNQKLVNFIKNDNMVKKYVWSSNMTPTLTKYLTQLEIIKQFEKIVSQDDVQLIKPETDGFEIINSEGFAKSSFLFIGDSTSDEAAAGNLKIDFLNVRDLT